MMYLAALAAVAIGIASVKAATCNTTIIASFLTSEVVTTCSSNAGYDFTSLTAPTGAEVAAMCGDSDCLAALSTLETSGIGDCTVGTFSIMTELVNPVMSTCYATITTTSSDNNDTASSTTGSGLNSAITDSSSGSSLLSTSASASSIEESLAPTPVPLNTPSSASAGNDEASTSQEDGSAFETSLNLPGAIAGIVFGCLAATVLVTALYLCRQRSQNKSLLANRGSAMETNEDEPQYQCDLTFRLSRTKYQETATTKSTAALSSHGKDLEHCTPSAGTWDDSVIVAARVPFDRIKVGNMLGKGSYGEVYRGKFRNQQVAIKRLLPETRKNMVHIEVFLKEIRLLASLDHPNIVQFVGVAWDSLSDLMCLTEFMDGGDLRSLLLHYDATRHTEGFDSEKTTIALEVAHALTYLHSLKPMVLHRDLKSRNIMLTTSLQAKLTDFGISRAWTDRTMTAGVGSMLWMAPEVMTGTHYDEKADVFSLGVVMSELDTHQLPYSNTRDAQNGTLLPGMAVLQLVAAGRLQVKLSDKLTDSIHSLIEQCVNVKPEDRPTAAQVLYELQLSARSTK